MQEAIIFVRQGGEVFGYERMEQVPAGMAVMSPEEVAEHLNPSQTLSELADAVMADPTLASNPIKCSRDEVVDLFRKAYNGEH